MNQPAGFGHWRTVVVVLACIFIIATSLGYLYYTRILGEDITKVRRNTIGVVRVEGSIIDTQNASYYARVINYAMINESVKAVVLVVDSPGGYARLIEQIYFDLLELKAKKPLTASVVLALSGGYYVALASDYIYVAPTSMVGNIGAIGIAPPTLIPSEQALETGAYKVTGFSKLLFPYNLSHALDNFVSAVETGRGDRLNLSPTQIRRGMIYFGSEAVTAGLADEIGTLQKAITRAAQEAGLVEYAVEDLTQLNKTRFGDVTSSSSTSFKWKDLTVEALNKLHPPPAMYYLYLPSEAFTQDVSSLQSPMENQTADMSIGKATSGTVLVDSSHGNRVSWWELDILFWELVQRNMTVQFVSQWDELESTLGNASALIVASPTETYSVEESTQVEAFVKNGGILLLFFDPAYEYLEIPAVFAPINSLSTQFGLSFAKGYLYNEEEHYGIYRNIYVRSFADTVLTQNLTSLVLFTATHIYSLDKGVAWAPEGTYSSAAERTGNYSVMALSENNETVMALGDVTFLREPYCYLEDNYELIQNLASAIAGGEVLPAPPAPEEKITRPNLAVGTSKNYTELVDGEEHLFRWFKVSELEVRVERLDRLTYYHYDDAGSLLRWISNGMEVLYEPPIPEEPYPLTKGKHWEYESGYTLIMEEGEYSGRLVGEEEVVGFEDVVAEDAESYRCAKVSYTLVDQFMQEEMNITIVDTGHSWISSEVGLVKEESTSQYFVNDIFSGEEKRKTLLIHAAVH